MKITVEKILKRIRLNILIVITGLALSGITAFPIEAELSFLSRHSTWLPATMQTWLHTVYNAVKQTNAVYPWLSYGTDWLAFAHLVLALLFVGPLRDPVKNIWVIQFGMLCCILIFPLAFIAGPIRQIPLFWRMIDCSFGVFGAIPLLISYNLVRKLNKGLS